MTNDFYSYEYWDTTTFVQRVVDGAYDTDPRTVPNSPPSFPTLGWIDNPSVKDVLDYRTSLSDYLSKRREWEEALNCPDFLRDFIKITHKFWKDCKAHFNLTEALGFDNAILEMVKEKPAVRYKEFYDRLVELCPIIEAHRKALESVRMQ